MELQPCRSGTTQSSPCMSIKSRRCWYYVCTLSPISMQGAGNVLSDYEQFIFHANCPTLTEQDTVQRRYRPIRFHSLRSHWSISRLNRLLYPCTAPIHRRQQTGGQYWPTYSSRRASQLRPGPSDRSPRPFWHRRCPLDHTCL